MKRVFETPDNGNYFFGYYDKSPLDVENQRLLACRCDFFHRTPTSDDVLEIGYFDWRSSDKFHKLTDTRAWNWQQGCMLQWIGPLHQEKIIYNDRVDDRFVTIIFDVATKTKVQLPMAYYSASSNGDFVLCIDNERHAWYRGAYSYKGIQNKSKHKGYIENDGIWRIDVETNNLEQIITLRDLVEYKELTNMKSAVHYVEHLMIAPCNKRFAFMHRWKTADGGIYSRLYTANVDGSDIYLLNDSGRMSHYCWRNTNEIVGWGGISNPINRLRKYRFLAKYFFKPLLPLYKKVVGGNSVDGNTSLSSMISGDSYIIFKDKTDVKQRLPVSALGKDGHPSFLSQNQNLMVTDTYPDLNNDSEQALLLYDMTKSTSVIVDTLNHNSDLARGGARCDLHPKCSTVGDYVAVDTLNDGYRAMYLYENDG